MVKFAGWVRSALFAAALSAPLIASTATAADRPQDEFPPISKRDYTPAQFGPHQPRLYINFPGGATARSISEGSATVAVLVGADGKLEDSLPIRYTDPSFAKALNDEIQSTIFSAAKFKKVNIPARMNVSYDFEGNVSATAMDQAARLGHGNSKDSLEPISEEKLDARLHLVDAVLPRLPVGYQVPEGKVVKAFVTFFVNTDGTVHAPNVESVESPELVALAIKAVRMWKFQPPLSGGKPALVFAGRAITFYPRKK
jgi:outer membrane biosynthesis protein TonB